MIKYIIRFFCKHEYKIMQENNDCIGNCANCGNTDCEWYDDFLDENEGEKV